jgi:hypothetical protein
MVALFLDVLPVESRVDCRGGGRRVLLAWLVGAFAEGTLLALVAALSSVYLLPRSAGVDFLAGFGIGMLFFSCCFLLATAARAIKAAERFSPSGIAAGSCCLKVTGLD